MEKAKTSETCVVCKKPISDKNWGRIKKIYRKMLTRVDYYGEMSLTEREQVIYHNRVCVDCIPSIA